RDQWLPVTGGRGMPAQRQAMEESLRRVVQHRLVPLQKAVPAALLHELREVMKAVAGSADVEVPPAPADPADAVAALPWWRCVSMTFLTKSGTVDWRKTLNKGQGFPPHRKELKERGLRLLEELKTCPGL